MKKKSFILLFIIAFIFIIYKPNDIYAKSYLSDKTETQYAVENGLLTGKANTICQTEDGYIWIGQYAGLTRYDSKKFFTMTNYNGINLTSIVTLANKGNILLIGSEKGFYVKDENNVITKVDTGIRNLVVKDIKVYGDYALVGTTSGLIKYNILDGSHEIINNDSVFRIAILNDDVYYYIVGKDKVYCNKINNPVVERSIKSLFIADNKLYLGTRQGTILIYELDDNGFIDNEYTLCAIDNITSTINDILVKNDEIFICSDDGFSHGDKNDLESIKIVKSYGDEYSSMEKSYFDYEGNLWLASSALGVYKISDNNITDYFFEYDIPKGITYAIEKYHGYTFIGTSNGIEIISSDGERIIEPEDEFAELSQTDTKLLELKYLIGNNSVRDIEIYNDEIYFATYTTGGNLFSFNINNVGTDKDTISILTYDFLSHNKYISQSAKDFRSLRACGGYLFIGLDMGVARFDGEESVYIETKVYPLYMTYHDDDLYIVLNTIGVVKASISNFLNYEKLDTVNDYSTLKCMYINDGVLFTDNNELYFYKNNEITHINLNIVGSVVDLAYLNNKYYICSEANVYVLDDIFGDELKYSLIDASNGLKSSLVANSSGYYSEEDEEYYFSTSSGVLVYDLDDNIAPEDKVQRRIAIDSIIVDGKEKNISNNIKLGSKVNNLTINFNVLSFSKDQHYTVYYRLKGYDDSYQRMDSNSQFEIQYKNLDGGKYSFELYTVDMDGTRSLNAISFNVTKDKMITEYEAFWLCISLLIVVAAVLAVVLFFRNRIKKSIARQNEYKKITLESIEAIARTIDAKDSYTNGHSKRVGIYSREIARALNLTNDEIDNIYYIALLHDIGKISIPLNILNKPGRLTDEEFEIMKTHTTAGGKILEGISTIPHIVEGAMYHHERYGGGGYPKGLKGEEIPFIARIICCADCYDAMATRRTYKEPYSKEKIISEFERCKGTQFDPKIADLVIQLIKEDRLRYGIKLKDGAQEDLNPNYDIKSESKEEKSE